MLVTFQRNSSGTCNIHLNSLTREDALEVARALNLVQGAVCDRLAARVQDETSTAHAGANQELFDALKAD